MSEMEYRKDVWFSPRKILLRYTELEQSLGDKFTKDPRYLKLRESRAVALMLLGIQKHQEREYWLQLVNPIELAPDIKTATQMHDEKNMLAYQNVEVVRFEEHSKEDIVSFLRRTKLSNEKAYEDETIILCHIEKYGLTTPWNEIANALSDVKRNHDVYLLGRTHATDLKYQLARVYPKFDQAVVFDATEEAKKPARDTMRFERSTKIFESHENIRYEPF